MPVVPGKFQILRDRQMTHNLSRERRRRGITRPARCVSNARLPGSLLAPRARVSASRVPHARSPPPSLPFPERRAQARPAIEAAANPGAHPAADPGGSGDGALIDRDGFFGIAPFTIPRGPLGKEGVSADAFSFSAPSARRNAARALRAMQLTKPILLEGSPGVGKTSLIAALARASGHALVRINLSEQTDMMDLLGADLPADGGDAGVFRWADGAFLSAVKNGDWVLLDELNLASQSVLEGLNAALDHRAEVFVPELGETFRCPASFRVFAAQNPVQEGGGRKGLPKSFLNRFTRVHVEPMDDDDLAHVARALYPAMPAKVVEGMVAFVTRLATAANEPGGTFARRGAPWEFNLRDVLRWCELADAYQPEEEEDEQDEDEEDDEKEEEKGLLPDDEGEDGPAPSGASPEPTCATFRALDATFETLFVRRLRCAEDRATCASLFEAAFGRRPTARPPPAPSIRDGALRVGGRRFPWDSAVPAAAVPVTRPWVFCGRRWAL